MGCPIGPTLANFLGCAEIKLFGKKSDLLTPFTSVI